MSRLDNYAAQRFGDRTHLLVESGDIADSLGMMLRPSEEPASGLPPGSTDDAH